MRTRFLAALLVAPLAALALTAPAAHADPDPDLSITKVELSRSSVAVSSLNTVPVKLTVTGGYDSSDPQNANLTLHAILKRTAGTGMENILTSMELFRTAGTTQNGTWEGNVNIPSTANGTFEAYGVMTGAFFPGSGSMTTETLVPNPPKLLITGTNQPKITARVLPDPLPFGQGYSIRWSVINGQTGKPYGTRLKVWLANDNGCVESFGGPEYLTDTNGYVTKAYPSSLADYGNCLLLPGNPAPNGGLGVIPNRPGIVTATPSKTSAPVGTIVPVNGTVAGAPNCSINLQRLYGATAWRTVGTAQIRQSGRFTVNAQPAYKGLIYYRVSFPGCFHFKSGVSKTFTIKGT
ncbi:hypothetical protein GCM10029976_059920 [Kribbella albertanoniae]|uniref:Uncharacterized protein n=1 Tax=Kribbella albertanoniae TaxID=1266829 RepID=A0A4R4QH50_9ACTN|nr:hypothetical protein [Kribbella albertanoniae]TDC34870.1 hypothetical protein E1261_02930 [Kribbella albertanoniae]